jgi:hypothetical protein
MHVASMPGNKFSVIDLAKRGTGGQESIGF